MSARRLTGGDKTLDFMEHKGHVVEVEMNGEIEEVKSEGSWSLYKNLRAILFLYVMKV